MSHRRSLLAACSVAFAALLMIGALPLAARAGISCSESIPCPDPECQTCEGGSCVAVPSDTPCTDIDGNLCTHAACNAGLCNQNSSTTICKVDTNDCTADPPCNPQTGLCEHPDLPDSTP